MLKTQVDLTAKERIKVVFLSQLEQHEFDKISVSIIIEQAGINKSTFYKYYASKYDLLENLQSELFEGFVARMKQAKNDIAVYMATGNDDTPEWRTKVFQDMSVMPGFLRYFDYVEEHKRDYLLFTRRMPNTFNTQHKDFIMNYCLRQRSVFDYWGEDPDLPSDIHAVIIANCYMGLIQHWLNTGMQLSKQEMGAMLTLIWKRLTGVPDAR